ncbi:MAG: S41 family peptidase [Chloroflexi bacterium]|nr:S41 family peptidase [Chloroflexota bacterium]
MSAHGILSHPWARRAGTVVVAVAIFAAGVAFGNGGMVGAQVTPNTRPPIEVEEDFAAFWETYNLINKIYLEPVERQMLVDGAINGMVEALGDEFSGYVEPELNAFDSDLSGSISGIGAVIERDEELGRVRIVNVYPGTPAERAGVLEGDVFLEVDGIDVRSFNADRLAARVRGPEGSTVNLVMERDGEEIEFAIQRARITIPNIETDVIGDNIAYVKLFQFTSEARRQFDQAISELDLDTRSGLIIDLRGNPGGLLSSAVSMASALIDDGVVLYEQFGDGTEQIFEADGTSLGIDIPIVVLVDERSASASELVVRAWTDYDLVTVVGTQTFGKGVVQSQRDLVNGGGLRLTVARWLSPNRESIHGEGLVPDVVVEWDEELRRENPDDDPQLDAALKLFE